MQACYQRTMACGEISSMQSFLNLGCSSSGYDYQCEISEKYITSNASDRGSTGATQIVAHKIPHVKISGNCALTSQTHAIGHRLMSTLKLNLYECAQTGARSLQRRKTTQNAVKTMRIICACAVKLRRGACADKRRAYYMQKHKPSMCVHLCMGYNGVKTLSSRYKLILISFI